MTTYLSTKKRSHNPGHELGQKEKLVNQWEVGIQFPSMLRHLFYFLFLFESVVMLFLCTESETTSPSERRSNGHYSTRSSNPSKRRRIECDSDHEAPRSRRGRNTRRNVAAINYVESDEDSAPDAPNISSRGRIRRPRRPVHF